MDSELITKIEQHFNVFTVSVMKQFCLFYFNLLKQIGKHCKLFYFISFKIIQIEHKNMSKYKCAKIFC